MKVYRIHLYDSADGSSGFEFFSSRVAAQKKMRTWIADAPVTRAEEIEPLEVPDKKVDLLRWLNNYAGHADNGGVS